MTGCCSHQDVEHDVLSTCQEVIHYPSEDYPCLCPGFEGEETCSNCGHPEASHLTTRVCKPRDGSYCACGT
jgi:hypothetical protein